MLFSPSHQRRNNRNDYHSEHSRFMLMTWWSILSRKECLVARLWTGRLISITSVLALYSITPVLALYSKVKFNIPPQRFSNSRGSMLVGLISKSSSDEDPTSGTHESDRGTSPLSVDMKTSVDDFRSAFIANISGNIV